MPKAVNFSQGSIIYFEGDRDERIFILQHGSVILSGTDIESGQPTSDYVKSGEFFGVKSALGHVLREETAMTLVPTVVVVLTVKEFELLFSQNKALIMKMLRVFSGQLRQIHRKTESILNNVSEDQQTGMLTVAKSFYDEEEFRSASDVYLKFLQRFPNSPKKEEVSKLYKDSKLRADRFASSRAGIDSDFEISESESSTLKIFELPAFERFAKNYENGQVIIAEHEPGDSFYLIQSGRVQLIKCVNGSKKNLDILKPGEFFGEMAILDNSPRSATCMASGKVKCLEFNKENFELLITGNPQIALHLLKLFCKRICDQKRRFKILVVKDLQARICDVFLMLDEMNTSPNPADHQRFYVTVSDVSHWAGLPIETTREEIKHLVEMRKIEVFEKYMVVPNINGLKRIYETRAAINSR